MLSSSAWPFPLGSCFLVPIMYSPWDGGPEDQHLSCTFQQGFCSEQPIQKCKKHGVLPHGVIVVCGSGSMKPALHVKREGASLTGEFPECSLFPNIILLVQQDASGHLIHVKCSTLFIMGAHSAHSSSWLYSGILLGTIPGSLQPSWGLA